jgi:hypothetical protein
LEDCLTTSAMIRLLELEGAFFALFVTKITGSSLVYRRLFSVGLLVQQASFWLVLPILYVDGDNVCIA